MTSFAPGYPFIRFFSGYISFDFIAICLRLDITVHVESLNHRLSGVYYYCCTILGIFEPP